MRPTPNKTNYTPELVAPAGDMEKLKFALAFGADAVYAGQPMFSLRVRDNGFKTLEQVKEGVDYTHAKGGKFYLTSNIIPHNAKIKSFQKSIGDYIKLGPDALIMSDPGMISFVRKNYPEQTIHLSVQANTTNWSTAGFWQNIGVKRIILSRELNLREIQEIREQVPDVELEVFIHGAVCVAHSGRCLLSNYMAYRDSNQGMCSNACRFKYNVYSSNKPQDEDYKNFPGEFFLGAAQCDDGSPENNKGLMPLDEDEYGTYFMSSRDISAMEHIPALTDMGVSAFKIEGRTKSLYYLSQAVRSYRGALDDLKAGRPVNPLHMQNVLKLDSRGYSTGFLSGNSELTQNYTATAVPSATAKVAGVVRGYNRQEQRAILSVKSSFAQGDDLEVVTPHKAVSIHAKDLVNHKGLSVTQLHGGMDGCSIYIQEDPGEFCFLIKKLQ